MKIGFTGTRHGLTDAQAAALIRWINRPCRIIARPGKSAKGGDNEWLDEDSLAISDEVMPVETHFARNRAIVEACEALIACPVAKPLPDSGGTAYTIQRAKHRGKTVFIVWPDGEVLLANGGPGK